MNIDDMPAGREIDALVAEKVMAGVWRRDRGRWVKGDLELSEDEVYVTSVSGGAGAILSYPPPFSTDIAAAWEVVDHLRSNGVYPNGEVRIEWDQFEWECEIGYHGVEGICQMRGAIAPTAALAICRAALKIAAHIPNS